MAVEQDDEFLNLTGEDAEDAFDAWAILSAHLDVLPPKARAYFNRLCAKVEEFDPHEDDEIALTHHLEVPVLRSKSRRRLGAKSRHDYAHIFDWVDSWQRMEGVNLDRAFWDYIGIHDLEPDQYETIKSAYHKVRRARLASMEFDQARSQE